MAVDDAHAPRVGADAGFSGARSAEIWVVEGRNYREWCRSGGIRLIVSRGQSVLALGPSERGASWVDHLRCLGLSKTYEDVLGVR
jgi:hypothetical protein